MNARRRTTRVISLALAAATLVSLTPALTSAGYTDSTFARTSMTTASIADTVPAYSDLSAASALHLGDNGELYVSGFRGTGDGNGNRSVPTTADPTRVEFPEGVRIVDAAGATDDYNSSGAALDETSFMALDDQGGVWTWGTPQPGGNPGAKLIGRGSISRDAAAHAGRVTTTETGDPLPPIVSIARIENQFLALDESGTMWAWGFGLQNLPTDGSATARGLPFAVRWTGQDIGNNGCTGTRARPNAGEVPWHSIWGGANGAAAVGQNGLVYVWGYDSSTGLPGSRWTSTRCPTLSEGANRALFQRYPELYATADGRVYDERELTTERARSERYAEIVGDLRDEVLPACAGTLASAQVDDSSCPVRQFGVDARHHRLLTQGGELLTWMNGSNAWGRKFLGRVPTAEQPEEVPAPIDGGLSIDRMQAGVSSVAAVTVGGVAYGWGDNNACQAVGAPTVNGAIVAGGCDNVSRSDEVLAVPTRIAGLPAGGVNSLTSTQCATWVGIPRGEVYAWGAGTVSGYVFNRCIQSGRADARGYKIYIVGEATPENPFGRPVTAPATRTVKVK